MAKREKREKAKLSKGAKITSLILVLLIAISVGCYAFFITRPAPEPTPMAYGIGNNVYVHIDADDFFGPFADYTSDNVVTHQYFLAYLGEEFYVVRMPVKDGKKLLDDYFADRLDFDKGIPFTGVTASYSRELAAYGATFVNELYEIDTVTPDYFMEVVGNSLIDMGRSVNDRANIFLLVAIFLLLTLFVVRSAGKTSARRKLYQRGAEPAKQVLFTADTPAAPADTATQYTDFRQGPAYEMTSIEKEMAERQAKEAQEAAARANNAYDAGGIYSGDIYSNEIGKND